MSDTPVSSDTPPPTGEGDTVDFVVGGHAFKLQVPTLWHAKQTGKHLPPGLIAHAEQAIDLVLASSADAAGIGKETLMRGCSLGEALKLAESLRTLYERAGRPMAQVPAAAPPVLSAGPVQSVALDLTVPGAGRSPNFA